MNLKGMVAAAASETICMAAQVTKADAIRPNVHARADGYSNLAWNKPHISVF
jgi:hypothetical protein